MKCYEYLVIEIHNKTKLQDHLTQSGAQGYRLACPPMKVGQMTYRIIMEREVPE